MGKVAENPWGQNLTQKDFRKQGDPEKDTSNINRTYWSNSKQHLHLHNEGCLWKTLDSKLIL